MDDWEIEKDKSAKDLDQVSVIGLNTEKLHPPTPASAPLTKEEEIDRDEKELSHSRRRSGVPEWHVSEEPGHPLSQTIDNELDSERQGDGKKRHTLAQISIERGQTLHDKATCSADVIRVWNQISHYIKRKLYQDEGVLIPGLGTFTIILNKNSLPKKNQFVLRRRPLFTLSPVLIYRNKLIDYSESVVGYRFPASVIKITSIAKRCSVIASMVEGIITEVVQTLSRALTLEKRIEFPFPYIGKLQIENSRVSMKFYADMYRSMGFDWGDGKRLLHTLHTKPEVNQPDFIEDELLSGQLTPLHQHIPSESFRSVFHIREVRSATEILDLRETRIEDSDCFGIRCLTRDEDVIFPPEPDRICYNVNTSDQQTKEKFLWCPPPSPECHSEFEIYEGEDVPPPDITKWMAQVRRSENSMEAEEIELEGEFDRSRLPPNPAPSLAGEDIDLVESPMPPLASEKKESEFALNKPCRHSYRAQPLYVNQSSGNELIDMVLTNEALMTSALQHHHYNLCARYLGCGTIRNHFKGKVTVEPIQLK